MSLVFHHIHARKRGARGTEPYPSRSVAARYFDNFMYVVGLVQPLGLLPQLSTVWINHNTAGVSFETWALFALFNVFWAVYGLVHKDNRIFIAYVLIAFLDGLIAVGAKIY